MANQGTIADKTDRLRITEQGSGQTQPPRGHGTRSGAGYNDDHTPGGET